MSPPLTGILIFMKKNIKPKIKPVPKPRARKVAPIKDLDDPDLYLNRELSWLAFNERVLGEAQNKNTPLLERLKFIVIYHSNLDEFFMVRLSNLIRIVEHDLVSDPTPYPDDSDPEETLDEVSLIVRNQLNAANKCLYNEILPSLEDEGISIAHIDNLTKIEEERLDDFFQKQVFPILTPLAIDPAHPFPYLSNLSLYLAINFELPEESHDEAFGIVEIPSSINRFILVASRGRKRKYVLLEDVIKRQLNKLFPWPKVIGGHLFRVTRNLDYQLLEGEVKDLVKSIEFELKDREQKTAVRLETEAHMPETIRKRLRTALELDTMDIYEVPRIVNPKDFSAILSKSDADAALRDPFHTPRIHPLIEMELDAFKLISEGDLLLHHPYDSFSTFMEFLRQSSEDPDVLAIKMTLYRTGGDSPVIDILVKAAENGKQVTAVVELKARFEERNNIVWAKRLERAGVHVVFGFVGLKTHAKCTLVVRRESGKLKRYVHLSTGNYNSNTARHYTDLALLSGDDVLTTDTANLFNLLTGFNVVGGEDIHTRFEHVPSFEKIEVAPFTAREFIIKMIDYERKIHSAKKPGKLIIKVNALTDPRIIKALYKASQVGVQVNLIVRGVCILRPGVPGLSENIRVLSILDRFLEHSRIYWFQHGAEAKVWLGSLDAMPRNLDRRVEIMWPVENPNLIKQIGDILNIYLHDNVKSHLMLPDGRYSHAHASHYQFRSQEKFIEIAKHGWKSEAHYKIMKSLEPKKTKPRGKKDV